MAKAAITEATAAPANNQPTTGVCVALATAFPIDSAFFAAIRASIAGIAVPIAVIKLALQVNQAEAPSFVIWDIEPITVAIAPNEVA